MKYYSKSVDQTITLNGLVEQCKRGDVRSFKILYDQYSRAMFNSSLRILKNRTDAEDVLQEAFIDIFRKINYFDGRSTIGAWMKRIVINKSIDFLRKRKIHFEELGDKNEYELQEDSSLQIPDELKIQQVKRGIDSLPTGYRTVLSLYLLEGYDHKEIAQILNVSESTTRTQYIRAKKKLLKIIQQY